MEVLSPVLERVSSVSKEASQVAKEEAFLSSQEILVQVGLKSTEKSFDYKVGQSTEAVNASFGSIRLEQQVQQQTENAKAKVRSDLAQFRFRSEQVEQFKLRGDFLNIQDAIDQVNEYMNVKPEIRANPKTVTIYDIAEGKRKLVRSETKTKARLNPVKSAVRFLDHLGLSAFWTKGAKRDSMTESAAMTQAAG